MKGFKVVQVDSSCLPEVWRSAIGPISIKSSTVYQLGVETTRNANCGPLTVFEEVSQAHALIQQQRTLCDSDKDFLIVRCEYVESEEKSVYFWYGAVGDWVLGLREYHRSELPHGSVLADVVKLIEVVSEEPYWDTGFNFETTRRFGP